MINLFEQAENAPNVEQELNVLCRFHKGVPLRIGIRGSRRYLDSILKYFNDKSFTIAETTTKDIGNDFPVPQDVSDAGYVVVVDSVGDWDNHTMNKNIKSADNLGISDQQNAIFVSWTQNKNETSGGGSEFDATFTER